MRYSVFQFSLDASLVWDQTPSVGTDLCFYTNININMLSALVKNKNVNENRFNWPRAVVCTQFLGSHLLTVST